MDQLHMVAHSEAGGVGAGTGVAIPIGGVKSTSTLLAVITTPIAGGAAVGRNPASFTPAAGSISSGSIDTTGLHVHAVWSD